MGTIIFFYSITPCTPLITSSAFKVLCKLILKKQFLISQKVLSDNLVIEVLVMATWIASTRDEPTVVCTTVQLTK